MKFNFVPILAGSILLFSCTVPKAYKTDTIPDNGIVLRDISLMPFERNGELGYINSDTFEIVIPEQYEYAGFFTGDFAVVRREKGNAYIINKNNKKVLGGFDSVTLYDTEDGNMAFALIGNNTDKVLRRHTFGEFIQRSSWRIDSLNTNYMLYNLTTGERVLNIGKADDFVPRLRFFGNYMTCVKYGHFTTFMKDVYEIQNDGSIVKNAMSIEELIAKIVKERNLQKNEMPIFYNDEFNDNFARDWKFDWFGYFNTLDMDKLIEQIPDNMKIASGYDWRYGGKVFEISLFSNFTHPLKDALLFRVFLVPNKNNEQGGVSIGLYNATENYWAIPPIKDSSGGFFHGSNDDWIIYDTSLGGNGSKSIFYNIRTRKIHKNQYKAYTGGARPDMIYMGHNDNNNKWYEKYLNPIIEDF